MFAATDPGAGYSPIEPLQPPAGAPNVLVVSLDDVGFGASSAFGGPVRMLTPERLAGGGLKYTRFYTTAMCAPRRDRPRNRRFRRPCGSTGTRRRCSASLTRCRSGRPVRWGRLIGGRRAAGLSISTGSSAGRRTSTPARGDRAGRSPAVARGGVHAQRGSRRSSDRVGATAPRVGGGSAVLHVLRGGRDARAASRSDQGVTVEISKAPRTS